MTRGRVGPDGTAGSAAGRRRGAPGHQAHQAWSRDNASGKKMIAEVSSSERRREKCAALGALPALPALFDLRRGLAARRPGGPDLPPLWGYSPTNLRRRRLFEE